MKKITALILTVAMAFGLTACGSKIGDIDLAAGQSGIYIQKDGTVSYGVSEKFDKDYYDKGDLEDKIEKEVADYNSSDSASVNDAITVDELDVSKDTAIMVLDIVTTYDFLTYMKNYNRLEKDKFYIGKIEDNSYCKIKGNFVSPDKKETKTKKEIKEMSNANILIVNEEYKVQIDGTVKYISENCKVDEKGIVSTAKAEDGTSYIVYENK